MEYCGLSSARAAEAAQQCLRGSEARRTGECPGRARKRPRAVGASRGGSSAAPGSKDTLARGAILQGGLGCRPHKRLPAPGLAPGLAVEDRLTVPEGFQSQLLAAWGDRLGDSRFGFNNDHLGFVQHAPDRASMTVNFEYISAVPWVQGFEEVVGKPLPFADLVSVLQPSDGVIDCTALPAGDRRLQQIRTVADEAMTDLGIGVMTLKRDGQGRWKRAQAPQDRRITGISGLDEPMQCKKLAHFCRF